MDKNMRTTIALETVDPQDVEFRAWLAAHQITPHQVGETPNGWAEVEYTGRVADLEEMAHVWWNDDAWEINLMY